MYFLLFLLIAMMIMLVVITTTNENSLINVVMIFLSIFVLIGGVYITDMKCKKIVLFIILCLFLILLAIYLGIIYFQEQKFYNFLSTDCDSYYLNNEKLSNVYFISNVNDKVDSDIKNIIIVNNIKLKVDMFNNINTNNIEKIIFLSTKPVIDSDLYEQIENKIVLIQNHNKCLFIEKTNNQPEQNQQTKDSLK